MEAPSLIRRALLKWYERNARALPWRASLDPYRIWVSEVMLQQTRAATVIPYYGRFLSRFPDAAALAAADEEEVLRHWSGLGYYQRARNLRRAAAAIAASGGFPRDYESIRALPGVGDYTAAAIASIAFGQPYPVLDGNVVRVLARLAGEPGDTGSPTVRKRLKSEAGRILDRRDPGCSNQALMELGATICLPREPLCGKCPLEALCTARQQGKERELPVRLGKQKAERIDRTLLLIERNHRLLLRQRDTSPMAGFWELPERSHIPEAVTGAPAGSFRHAITNRLYTFNVVRARVGRKPAGFAWFGREDLAGVLLSTVARKALALGGGRHAQRTQVRPRNRHSRELIDP